MVPLSKPIVPLMICSIKTRLKIDVFMLQIFV
jgi:hypothetical protein